MKHGMITTNFAYEFGYCIHGVRDSLIDLSFYIRYKGDHPGFFFCFYLFGYGVEFNIYDVRHEDEESWENYADEYYAVEEYY